MAFAGRGPPASTGLIVLNILLVNFTSEDFIWVPFPLIGWGIGLSTHYLFAVRRGDQEVRSHQAKIKQLAERRIAA